LKGNTIPRFRLTLLVPFPVRCFGIYDTVVGSTTEAQLEAGKKQFRESLAELSTLEKFRYKEFKSLMEKWSKKAGATGWKQNLPSFMQSGSKEDLAEMKKHVAILNQFSRRELTYTDKEKIPPEDKRRIAEAANATVVDVNKVLKAYGQQITIHGWLRSRIKRDLPLPESPEDMRGLMNVDPPKLSRSDKRQRAKQMKKMKQPPSRRQLS